MCFVPRAVAHLSDEALAEIAQDTAVIRNHQKINATRDNASLVLSVAEQHGSFGAFLADWPDDDVVGLQQYLKKAGSRLGGHTGQYFLRFSGKDTFMFSKDVVRVLIEQGVVDREPTSKKGLSAAQAAFNDWREETGLAFCKLSQIMAWSVG
jgi:3-methyladenine DNA glycosylase Tag